MLRRVFCSALTSLRNSGSFDRSLSETCRTVSQKPWSIWGRLTIFEAYSMAVRMSRR